MTRWIRLWLDAWPDETVTMSSDLPIEVVRDRLRARTVTYRQAAFRGGISYGVLGRIGDYDIEVECGYIAVADWGRPALSGRLEPTATGTRVVASIGRTMTAMTLGAVVGGVASLVFLLLFGRAIALTVAGEVTGPDFIAAGAPLVAAVLCFAFSMLGTTFGRREVAYLRSWLAEGLQATGGSR
jgi:hypothetical protein